MHFFCTFGISSRFLYFKGILLYFESILFHFESIFLHFKGLAGLADFCILKLKFCDLKVHFEYFN